MINEDKYKPYDRSLVGALHNIISSKINLCWVELHNREFRELVIGELIGEVYKEVLDFHYGVKDD